MFARQAAKAKAAKATFTGFKGSPERVALLEMMRPQVPWHVRAKVERQLKRIDDAAAAMGIPPLTPPTPVEGVQQ